MLSIESLYKTFSMGGNEKITALNNVNLVLDKGSFTTIIGGNGSGKSTLLNCIAGNIQSDSGTIKLNGKDITKQPVYQRAGSISRLFQDPNAGTAPDLSIVENFRLAAIRSSGKKLKLGITRPFRQQTAEILEPLGLGLEDKLDQSVGQLSGGQRQAMALLMALFDPPLLLLLDEPTAALDPKAAKFIMELADQKISELGLTCLWVTHNMQDAIQFGTRLIQMHQGVIRRDILTDQKQTLNALDLMGWFLE